MHAIPTPTIPSHVPAHLVGTYPLVLGQTTLENPFENIIPRLHEGPEAMYVPNGYLGFGPSWVFRRAKDMQAIYLDTEHFSSKDFAPFAKMIGDSWSQVPAETDPPMHALYRAMVNPLFLPQRIAKMEERTRRLARGYIAKFKDKGECDFLQDFAFRFPIAVFLDLMGLPLEQVEQFLAWETKLLHEPDMAQVAAAVLAVKTYLLTQIAERRQNPGDDFISYALAAEIQGRRLTEDELIGFTFGLFIGGLDTVSANMALHFRHLAEHPEQQALLRANPDMIPGAVEELLRAYAAVTTFRTCVKPVIVSGVQIMPGDKVALVTTLAGRDPNEFEQPNEVRLDRNPRHITFASGPHRCVGAPLARRELVIAMEELLSQLPEFRIKPGARIVSLLGGVIQPATLPLVW